jgi:hypothetical protein
MTPCFNNKGNPKSLEARFSSSYSHKAKQKAKPRNKANAPTSWFQSCITVQTWSECRMSNR